MGTLNSTIVNVALPVMSQEMNVSISAIQWVISAYLLTTVLLLPIFGKLSEFIGKKNVFAFGTLLFAIGSGLCAFSQTLGTLTVSRILQAVGSSGMFSMSMGIVSGVFPPPKEAARSELSARWWPWGRLQVLVSAESWSARMAGRPFS